MHCVQFPWRELRSHQHPLSPPSSTCVFLMKVSNSSTSFSFTLSCVSSCVHVPHEICLVWAEKRALFEWRDASFCCNPLHWWKADEAGKRFAFTSICRYGLGLGMLIRCSHQWDIGAEKDMVVDFNFRISLVVLHYWTMCEEHPLLQCQWFSGWQAFRRPTPSWISLFLDWRHTLLAHHNGE